MASQDASATDGDATRTAARVVLPRTSRTASSEALFEVETPAVDQVGTLTARPAVDDPEAPGSPERRVIQGDARSIPLEDNTVDLVVTSPPYWQKRDYKVAGQIGQEPDPAGYVAAMMDCLTEWRRVLRPTGSVFLNVGDTWKNQSLAGIPGRIEAAAADAGWLIRNRIIWAKTRGMPDPVQTRLASRHEYIIHLTPQRSYYYDLFAYARKYGRAGSTANPGDVWDFRNVPYEEGSSLWDEESPISKVDWDLDNPGDIWDIDLERNMARHLAPFPSEIVQRAVTLACPLVVCTECGRPRERVVEKTAELDASRPQAKRAMELAREKRLTAAHIAAIQATGISDAGKALHVQTGTGRNAEHVRQLAAEAKAALGGYFREFTFAPKRTVAWTDCGHDSWTHGTVLDPFLGTGTTLNAAHDMRRSVIGVDLNPVPIKD
ncbi:DNA-methyltransferase [Streptomyces sp. SudanB182_2057]|uniref:DNA-methyltransferase n=1 Tax=Streptomyces sp. SudanB182_2057 TaxID=3035281 RepID=UPI003F556BD3